MQTDMIFCANSALVNDVAMQRIAELLINLKCTEVRTKAKNRKINKNKARTKYQTCYNRCTTGLSYILSSLRLVRNFLVVLTCGTKTGTSTPLITVTETETETNLKSMRHVDGKAHPMVGDKSL